MDAKFDIWGIIVRHLEGSLSDEESEILRVWLRERPENRKTLQVIERIWHYSDPVSQQNFLNEIELANDWRQIKHKILEKNRVEKTERIKKFRKIRRRQSLFSTLIKVAALCLVAALSVLITLQLTSVENPDEHETVFRVISTNAGERANVDLGDGTQVTLNAESTIEVPDVFTTSERFVKASGQVFFRVTPDEQRPFYVKTEHAVIRVIGTSFDIRTYPDESDIRVVVRDGTVEMQNSEMPARKIILNEGHLGKLNRDTGEIEMEVVEDLDYYTGWLEGRLIFQNSPFHHVLAQIRRWYDVEITLDLTDETLLQREFTADLKMRSVSNVFDVIAMSMNLDYDINDESDQIIIRN